MTDAFRDIKALNKTYLEMTEGKDTEKWPSIKDHKPPTKVNVKYDKHQKQFVPTIKETLDATCLFTDEEMDAILDKLELSEMRKQDKVAGVPKGGTDNEALRIVKKQLKQMHGGQQKKKVRGAKPSSRPRSEGLSPAQKVEYRRQRIANRPDPYRPRAGESD